MPVRGVIGWILTPRGRVVFDGFVIVLVLCTPWYIPFVVGVIGAVIYESYWELWGIGIIMDALFGVWGLPWTMLRHTIIYGAVFGCISILRKKLFVFS